MTRKSPYPTRADYPALIENAKPALRELLEAASYERRIAVLNECSLDVVNTVCTIMVLGRHSGICPVGGGPVDAAGAGQGRRHPLSLRKNGFTGISFAGASAPAYRPDERRKLCQRNPVKTENSSRRSPTASRRASATSLNPAIWKSTAITCAP